MGNLSSVFDNAQQLVTRRENVSLYRVYENLREIPYKVTYVRSSETFKEGKEEPGELISINIVEETKRTVVTLFKHDEVFYISVKGELSNIAKRYIQTVLWISGLRWNG